jgi:hypothetical protein
VAKTNKKALPIEERHEKRIKYARALKRFVGEQLSDEVLAASRGFFPAVLMRPFGLRVRSAKGRGGLRVFGVGDGSNATTGKGLTVKVGDELAMVEGTDVRGMAMAELAPLLLGPAGSSVALVFSRPSGVVAETDAASPQVPPAMAAQHEAKTDAAGGEESDNGGDEGGSGSEQDDNDDNEVEFMDFDSSGGEEEDDDDDSSEDEAAELPWSSVGCDYEVVDVSRPPSARGLNGKAIAFFEDDCGWFAGAVVRKAHGSGGENYTIKFDGDAAEVKTLEASLFHHGPGAPPIAQHGAWCLIEKKKAAAEPGE